MEKVFFLKRSVHGNLKTATACLILDGLSSNSLCMFFTPMLSFFVLDYIKIIDILPCIPRKPRKFDLALAIMTSLQKKPSDDFIIFLKNQCTDLTDSKNVKIRGRLFFVN